MKMTKKAEKAAAVEANKFAAYAKKVRTLAGWVKVSDGAIKTAYSINVTAEAFAVSYACQTAVGAAIWPLKLQAVQAAAKRARETIETMAEALKAAEWKIDAVAPRPDYRDANYRSKSMTRAHYESIFSVAYPRDYHSKEPAIASRNGKLEVKYISDAEKDAAYQYDLFVMKLVAKIGPDAVSATLQGDHVWSYSVLTVTMKDETVQRWKTQQITNCSKLGLWFPQWPSRLMKGGK